jgi:hypothetical protein
MLASINQQIVPALFAVSLLIATPSFADSGLGVPDVVPYAEDSDVRQAIKDECQLSEKMSTYLRKYIDNTVPLSDSLVQGRYLDISITEVHAAGGGGFSGSKWMGVQGTLIENGEPVASFIARRNTRGGGWGACGAAQRCAKAISKDISKWVGDPVDGAKLGDAK